MFEQKTPKVRAERLAAQPADDAGIAPLRALKWSDLVGRLAATRDLRSWLQAAPEGESRSFDVGSPTRFDAHHQGKDGVYRDDLANGKPAGDTTTAKHLKSISGVRGT